jgi:hypothetical protein
MAPQQRPMARPVSPQQRSMPPAQGYDQGAYAQQQPAGRPQPAPRQQRAEADEPMPRKTAAWKVVLQFVVGLIVIVGVAAAIVALYVRYYQ